MADNNHLDFGLDLLPVTDDTYYLGKSGQEWKLYASEINGVDLSSTYGDAYTPVYWNAGTPTAVSPVLQVAFTINSGKYGVKLTSDAFTTDSIVLQIVVTSGIENLKNTITWQSYNNYINIKTGTQTGGNVVGYILVSRGGDSLSPTAADISTNT